MTVTRESLSSGKEDSGWIRAVTVDMEAWEQTGMYFGFGSTDLVLGRGQR